MKQPTFTESIVKRLQLQLNEILDQIREIQKEIDEIKAKQE